MAAASQDSLCQSLNDRLYLLEYFEGTDLAYYSEEEAAIRAVTARRVFVLTPLGETMQVYDCRPHLHEGDIVIGITVFNGQLFLATHFGSFFALCEGEGIKLS